MQLVTYEIDAKSIGKAGKRALPVMFVGDIQWIGEQRDQACLKILKENLRRGLEIGARFVGMGDFCDTFSPSNRSRLAAASLYDTAMDVIDSKNDDLIRELYKKALEPTKGRWLGVLSGHHWHQFKVGDTTDMRFARLLDCPFLGDCSAIRLVFGFGNKKIPATIWVHHGHGAGQTGYYPLTRLEKVAASWEEIDVFCMGHTCRSAIELSNKLRVRWETNDLTHRKVTLVGAGGYSRAYIEGAMQGQVYAGGYAEKKMMSPTVLGSPVVWFKPKLIEGRLGLDISAEV